ncbi:MAG: HepT-like ribonuclease domain-containing protein [Planctomycetota bacterium]
MSTRIRFCSAWRTWPPNKPTAGIRDTLIHDYVGVNQDAVWKTVTEDLPPLSPRIQRAVRSRPSRSGSRRSGSGGTARS